jgi:hypothetical protein
MQPQLPLAPAVPLGDAAGAANGVAVAQQLSPQDLLVDDAIGLIDAVAAENDQQLPPPPPQQQQHSNSNNNNNNNCKSINC